MQRKRERFGETVQDVESRIELESVGGRLEENGRAKGQGSSAFGGTCADCQQKRRIGTSFG